MNPTVEERDKNWQLPKLCLRLRLSMIEIEIRKTLGMFECRARPNVEDSQARALQDAASGDRGAKKGPELSSLQNPAGGQGGARQGTESSDFKRRPHSAITMALRNGRLGQSCKAWQLRMGVAGRRRGQIVAGLVWGRGTSDFPPKLPIAYAHSLPFALYLSIKPFRLCDPPSLHSCPS